MSAILWCVAFTHKKQFELPEKKRPTHTRTRTVTFTIKVKWPNFIVFDLWLGTITHLSKMSNLLNFWVGFFWVYNFAKWIIHKNGARDIERKYMLRKYKYFFSHTYGFPWAQCGVCVSNLIFRRLLLLFPVDFAFFSYSLALSRTRPLLSVLVLAICAVCVFTNCCFSPFDSMY